MAFIQDSDLLCVERGGRSYRWTGLNLKDQVIELSPVSEITGDLPIIITQLPDRVVNISIRDGTINQKGAVQLTNDVTSAQTYALTPKGAKDQLDNKTDLDGGNAEGIWPISISGNADTATNAVDSTNSVNAGITRDDISNANRYITFVDDVNAGNKPLRIDNGLSYNPSTNTLSCSYFDGDVIGTASNADQAENAENAVNATYATNVVLVKDNSNNERFLNFSSVDEGNARIRADGGVRYNPFLNRITTGNLTLSEDLTARKITATDARINGNASIDDLSAKNATLSGDLKGRNATFTGNLTANTSVINGLLTSGSINTGNIRGASIVGTSADISGHLSAGTAAVLGDLSVSNITGKSVNFSGSLTCQSATVRGNLGASNINVSNKITASSLDLTGHMTGKSIGLSTSLIVPTIEGTTAEFAGTLTAATINATNFTAANGSVTGRLTFGTIEGTTANLSGTLSAAAAVVRGETRTNTLKVTSTATCQSVSVSAKLTARDIEATNGLTTKTASISSNLSVGNTIQVANDINCSDRITAKNINATNDITCAGEFTVTARNDARAKIYNDGSAYFSNEKIRLRSDGDITCEDISGKSLNTSGTIVSSGRITANGGLTSTSISGTTGSFSGRVTVKELYSASSVRATTLTITGTGSVTGKLQVGSLTASSIKTTLDANIGRNLDVVGSSSCGTLVSRGDAYVGRNLVVRTGSDNKAVIYNDGSAYFSNDKIKFTASGDAFFTNTISCRDLNSLSDKRYKTDITQITGALSSIEKLNGVNFSWIETGSESMGVIAQEVEKVLPKLITEKENFKSVNYNGLVGVLIEAVKELSARVEELENN